MRKEKALYEPITVEWAPGFQFLRAGRTHTHTHTHTHTLSLSLSLSLTCRAPLGRTGDYKSEFDDAMRARFEVDAERVLGKALKERLLGAL